MNEGTLIAEFAKNTRERVRVSLREFQGHKLLDIRVYYQDPAGDWRPGKGLALRRDLLPDLKRALTAADRVAKTETQAPAA